VEGYNNVVGQPIPIVSYNPETRTLVIATGYEAFVQIYGPGTSIPYYIIGDEEHRGAAVVESHAYLSNTIVFTSDPIGEYCDNGFVYSYYQSGASRNLGTYSHA